MIENVVQYLHKNGVSFRLSSHPSPEKLPAAADAVTGRQTVQTRVLMVGGTPAIACLPQGTNLDLARLRHELGAEVREGSVRDLPAPYSEASEPIPPLGGAVGALVIVDESIIAAPAMAFDAFSSADSFEVPYDQFALLERPRVASFAIGGELPGVGETQ